MICTGCPPSALVMNMIFTKDVVGMKVSVSLYGSDVGVVWSYEIVTVAMYWM